VEDCGAPVPADERTLKEDDAHVRGDLKRKRSLLSEDSADWSDGGEGVVPVESARLQLGPPESAPEPSEGAAPKKRRRKDKID